jgi:predicted DNA-binding transcriptional regulator YafY
MPANKQAALRYQIINRCLRNKYKRYPSKEDLRQACEDALFNSSGERISMSTIDKDLNALRNDLTLGYEAPIRYSKEYGGYYYEDPEYSIDQFPLGEEHLEAIRFAAATLEQFKDSPLFDQFESAIGKISDRVNLSPGIQNDDISQRVQFEWAPKAGGAEFLKDLYHAITNQLEIKLRYRSFKRDESRDYELRPYLLKEYRNRWYLIAYSEKRSFFVTFGLDRIESIELSDKYFKRKADFDPKKFFENSFGITAVHDSEIHKVMLRFSPNAAQYIKSQALHRSQKIIEESDENTLVSYDLMISYELEQAILGFGEEVVVIEPEVLRKNVEQRIAKMAALYSKSS